MLLSAVLISTDSFSTGFSEVPKKQMELGLEGMIGVSYGSNTLVINGWRSESQIPHQQV